MHSPAQATSVDTLAQAIMPCAAATIVDHVHKPVRIKGRPSWSLNVLSPAEQKLFFTVLRDDYLLRGFRNTDVLAELCPTPAALCRRTSSRDQCRLRKLHLLCAHGLIRRVPRSYRYLITQKGESLMNPSFYIRYKAFPKELTV